MKSIAILGSTGSIGTSTLDVIEAHPDRFRVVALAAGSNSRRLRQQIAQHRPEIVCVASSSAQDELSREFPDLTFECGPDGLLEVASTPAADMVVVALVGALGCAPTIAAIEAGKDIALANKETLVIAGSLVVAAARAAARRILPIDSEHAAIHQAIGTNPASAVARLVLTASGGPFRTWSAARIARATVDDALAHPTWQMGRKITIDSATMMNKGLEVIEAHHLFGMPEDRIDVVIHPQSLVHSIVDFVDGSSIAQISVNDMRVPILYALAWPERIGGSIDTLDLTVSPPLTFAAPDGSRFPCLDLARAALRDGGLMPAVLSAANEVAVAAFLDGQCPFPAIAETVATALDRLTPHNGPVDALDRVLAADREARRVAFEILRKYQAVADGSEKRW